MKNNNKGFSLVELIVVIAIMAVLVGVLAPSLLRYVEKSRAQKDDSAMAEVTNAIQLALADEKVYDEVVPATGSTVDYTFTPSSGVVTIATTLTTTNLQAEVTGSVGSTITLNSRTYKAKSYKVTVTFGNNGNVQVVGNWQS